MLSKSPIFFSGMLLFDEIKFMKNERLLKWKEEIYELNKNTFYNSVVKECLGFYSIDGKIIDNPELLILGYNPGNPGNKSTEKVTKFETFENLEKDYNISYLECLKEDYRYHLAEKTTNIFRKAGLADEIIEALYTHKTVKTNLYHLISKDSNALPALFQTRQEWKSYRDKMHHFMYELIILLNPKLVLIEGITTWQKFIINTYDTWNRTWNERNHFGYYFKDDIEFVGYNRNQNTIEAAKLVGQIIEQRFDK